MLASNLELVNHIHEEIQFCLHATRGENEDSFIKDEIIKRAVVRAIEIIGEASKKLDTGFKAENNHIPWKKMAGMRDVLIHDYMGVDYELVWEVVSIHLPKLLPDIQSLINTKIP
jgi:uncharacterized protein with HEPN domain